MAKNRHRRRFGLILDVGNRELPALRADLLAEYERLRDQLTQAPASSLVVFVDLVGSTAFKEQHGLFEGALRSNYHNRLVQSVAERHGLKVVKSLGDGLLLEAGPAEPHESGALAGVFAVECLDAPERSVLSGQPALQSRIGIALGQVVRLEDGDILGPAVDLASRLKSVAKPNQAIAQATMFDRKTSANLGFSVSKPMHIAIRGVAEPVAVAEIVPRNRRPQGVDCRERWSDYDYIVSLHRLAGRRWPRISRDHLDAVIHLAYRGVLRARTFDFVAMEAGSPFSAALRDPAVFSCFYFAPTLFRSAVEAARFFKVETLVVNGVEAIELPQKQSRPEGMFIRRRFAISAGALPAIGARCDFSYTVRTVVPRQSSFFSMITEQEVESPTFAVHAEGIAVEWLRFAPFLPPEVGYEPTYYPNRKSPTAISLRTSGVVPAGSGVSFMWRERRSKNALPSNARR